MEKDVNMCINDEKRIKKINRRKRVEQNKRLINRGEDALKTIHSIVQSDFFLIITMYLGEMVIFSRKANSQMQLAKFVEIKKGI